MCTDAFQEPVPKPIFAWAIAQGQHVASALMDGPRSPPVASGAPHQVTRLCLFYRSEHLLGAESWLCWDIFWHVGLPCWVQSPCLILWFVGFSCFSV